MTISVEISKYPLTQEYEVPILAFIDRLHENPQLTVQTNTMSTQVFGPYEAVMETINSAMRQSFESPESVVMVMKFINKDLKPTNP